nr:glycosyltransferase family 4 protein [Micromonospora sp. DSM 115978]
MTGVLAVFGSYGATSTSGAERMAWRTCAALMARGHDVVVLTDGAHPDDLAAGGWRIHRGDRDLATAWPDWRPAVVHAYDLALPDHVDLARALARRFGARFVLTPASAPEIWPAPARAAAALREAATVYALTEAEVEVARSRGARRVTVIPQAPDLVGRGDPAGFRHRHGITGPIVLYLGRRVAAKGYPTLLAAAPLLWRTRPTTTFVLIGPDGEPATTAAFLAGARGRVLDLGLADDRAKHDALAACDLLCLPTSADIFPLVFVEAWACGKPVVSGDFPGVAGVVRHGVDGIVVRPDPGEVADALRRLLDDDAARAGLGGAGQRRVAAGMTWDHVARAVERDYPDRAGPAVATNGRGDHDVPDHAR